MKQIKWLMAIALVALSLSSCEKKDAIIDTNNLYGLWQKQNTSSKEYMRFLTADEQAQDGSYFFGKEWNESDGVYENDLKKKGNGWFKWSVSGTTLTMIHLMDNGGAEVPKTYTITTLTTGELILRDNANQSVSTSWTKK